MSLFEFGRLIYRNATYLLVIPILLASLVFVFTINDKKQYASGALIYTGIASGFNIESGSSDKVDYHAVNNAFDNLTSIVDSKQTIEEVLLRLLAIHIDMLQKGETIPANYQEFLDGHITVQQQKGYYSELGVDSTYAQLDKALKINDPVLINIIRGENVFYSGKLLNTLEVKRHKSSDMLKLYYTAENPAICKLVVELVIQVFTSRYRALKVAETGDVVAYFNGQLDLAQKKLNKAEDKLTAFRTGTRVINYGEQTKAIAIKKQNAIEEYSTKKMNLLSIQVALTEIEDKLKMRENLLSKNSNLLNKRNQLSDLVQQLARSNSSDKDDPATLNILHDIDSLKKDIQLDLEVIFSYSNSKEGLPNKQLLNQWLEYVISLNREKANVDYFKNRLSELDSMYDTFAPLGSTLARLEREISVAEREYLEILSGLNMSKIRQQNLQLSSNLEIVDWPNLPTQALASKRKLLVIIGFLFGLISVLTILLAREILDNTISTPSKAEKASNLTLIGAFPVINDKLKRDYPNLMDRLKSLSVSKLVTPDSVSRLIVIFSVQVGEGKSRVTDILASELRNSNFKVHVIKPSDEKEVVEYGCSTYESDSQLNQATSLKALKITAEEGITILELPALTKGRIPYELIKTADQCIMVARADKAWSVAQSRALKDWKGKVGSKPFLILNGVKPYNMEEFIGEIGTKHNFLIKGIRKMAKFEFGNNAFGNS